MQIPINEIVIGERQRIDLGDLTDLDSMSDPEVGQILPVIIDQNKKLVDGRRRMAKAIQLGWTTVRIEQQDVVSEVSKQKKELFADIGRKDRTWQEKCLATEKLFRLIAREHRANGDAAWTTRAMGSFTGQSKSSVAYALQIAEALYIEPKDGELWKAENYLAAIGVLRDRRIREAEVELHKRRAANPVVLPQFNNLPTIPTLPATGHPKDGSPSPVQQLAATGMKGITLRDRANIYNQSFQHLNPPNTPLFYVNKGGREFIHAFWFVGGGNISELYGSYQIEYLKRIETLFPDARKVVHLFVGSLPPSDKYVRVGLPQGDTKPDIECDAHQLSSRLPFKADLIYADPPYSIEDSEHYANCMVNRERVISECAAVLEPGGFLVWLDQALPIFSNNDLQFVGAIAYIRSTANRFRVVSIFRKPTTPNTSCPQPTNSEVLSEPTTSSSPATPSSIPTSNS